ncbi:hypothetical protein SAMN02910400_01647 [Lachnospiraceae bacterium C10]|nr:hypothetical protein SAMN02910400_01647 [Lachnospiraceae bacterium C10]
MEVQWKTKEQLGEYVMERLNHDPRQMSDKERNRMSERIRAKLKAGKKLSPEEIRFLQQTDPAAYMEYLRIRQMADSLKAQLKSARTKQEVNRIIAAALNSVSDKDPAKEYIIAAMNEVIKEFKATPEYKKLPDTDADLAKKKRKSQPKGTANQEEDFNPMDWSPLQEVIDELPTFDHPA